jgi:hypothetical protein
MTENEIEKKEKIRHLDTKILKQHNNMYI